MLAVVRELEVFAPALTPVVFVGETGTGKTFFARALHELSGRAGDLTEKAGGEIRPELAESEIFGHVRGAFTGAVRDRAGLFARAGTGTLLFDDFHLLHRAVQYMLLGPFDTRTYRPVGSDHVVPLGCRLVIGIGEHPDVLVERKRLLPDLRYRLGHCIIVLPRLEERREEIALLAQRFLGQAAALTGVADGPGAFAPEALGALEAGHYRGNLRDLRDALVPAYLRARRDGAGAVLLQHLPPQLQLALKFERGTDRATQRRVVSLWKTGGHLGEAAELIGAHRNTVAALRLELERRGGRRSAASNLEQPS
ncbi:MAG: sigma-54-dependent transcriptional regulator [Candidatus Methylomirabilaceae bacterium]